jgi:hypothetical protein
MLPSGDGLDLSARHRLAFPGYAGNEMTHNPTDAELAEAILAAIPEAREHGVPENRILEMLADIVKGLS